MRVSISISLPKDKEKILEQIKEKYHMSSIECFEREFDLFFYAEVSPEAEAIIKEFEEHFESEGNIKLAYKCSLLRDAITKRNMEKGLGE